MSTAEEMAADRCPAENNNNLESFLAFPAVKGTCS